ncbi:MAG: flagellar cap protein [Peptococcaceae bacterium]|nr:MAG: flagellar cap protein [Peptococcaceae bacterium]
MNSILRISGLASGLDTETMIRDLMKVKRIPVDKLKQNKQIMAWKREDLREINRSLLSFRSGSAFSIKLQSTFQAKKATSTNETIATAEPATGTPNTTYTINISQIAEVASNTSSAKISADVNNSVDLDATLMSQKSKLAGGTFFDTHSNFSFTLKTYNHDGTSNEQTFSFDANTQSLNDVLTQIGNSSPGLTAFYAKGSTSDGVSLSTTKTGDNNSGGYEIEITDTDGFLADVLNISQANEQGGKDATLTINGMDVVEHTNNFTVNGVVFNIHSKTASMAAADAVKITVQSDADKIFNSIKTFVDEYNALIKQISDKLSAERYRDYLPLTDEQREQLTDTQIEKWEEKARSGLLRNNSLLNKIMSDFRTAIASIVSGLPATINRLSQIGITTGGYDENGKLYIDETKLKEAISQNSENITSLFTQDATSNDAKGIGRQIYDAVSSAINNITTEAGNPNSFSLYESDNLSNSIRTIEQRLSTMEKYLAQVEERYIKQFAALETVINQMNTQSAWLSQQFSTK